VKTLLALVLMTGTVFADDVSWSFDPPAPKKEETTYPKELTDILLELQEEFRRGQRGVRYPTNQNTSDGSWYIIVPLYYRQPVQYYTLTPSYTPVVWYWR
jgi:hypothetical protein